MLLYVGDVRPEAALVADGCQSDLHASVTQAGSAVEAIGTKLGKAVLLACTHL